MSDSRKRVIVAIQVRIGSTRLLGKVLADVVGKPLLWHLVERTRAAKTVDEVVIATSASKDNAPIQEFARKHGVPCYAGSEQDLIDRLYRAAQHFGAHALVRITGDCPLADPAIVDEVVSAYLDHPDELDYVSNILPPSYPDGLDTEVYPTKTLQRLWNEIKDPLAREWFPKYLWDNQKDFRIANVASPTNLSALRWTVDYEEDLTFVREIFRHLYVTGKVFSMHDILKLLEAQPELTAINAKYTRNEGLQIALEQALGKETKTP